MPTNWIQKLRAFITSREKISNQFSKLVQDLLRLQDNYKPNVKDDMITAGLLFLFIVLWTLVGPQ